MKNGNNLIEIRLAENKEALVISDLLYQSFSEYKLLYTERAFAATTLGIPELESRISKNVTWVGLYDDTIAGTISLMPNGNGIFIKSVAVAPIARKKGLGKELMRHAEKIALKEGAHYLELTTTAFLLEAIRLYEFFGFRQNGRDDLYGTPLIKMIKYLDVTTVLSEEKMRFNY